VKYREILEFNKSKIEKVQGNNVTIDHGDGTKTVIDKKKNPSALQKDNQGQVKLNNDPKNKNKNPASIIKPGDKVELDANK